ncbi:hypothetical protein HEB94_007034 [Actinopolymorpha pittospori]|uniref:Uncharacterized protein n=1 Tax=Actinopolymorpha pittospori TaxID=648752 RepID=A0A927RMH4_9ACTN|nr:hypothetical protein [Actinopolymorpha pittospori]MBE1610186.1 hypothetical protein [Actinopolymorpha pittospori]
MRTAKATANAIKLTLSRTLVVLMIQPCGPVPRALIAWCTGE